MNRSIRLLPLIFIGAALPAYAATGVAVINPTSAASKVAGTLKLADTDKGLSISGDITGLTPGQHGFHIHEFGACSDDGKAAGGHYNPAGHPHGNTVKDGPAKAHAGDMGNLVADASGTAKVDLVVPGLTLTGPVSAAGRAFIVHEKADDFGQPVGNAGGRVGCGTIAVSGN